MLSSTSQTFFQDTKKPAIPMRKRVWRALPQGTNKFILFFFPFFLKFPNQINQGNNPTRNPKCVIDVAKRPRTKSAPQSNKWCFVVHTKRSINMMTAIVIPKRINIWRFRSCFLNF